MFLEMGHSLLHSSGQLGMIVPSGIYTDKGTTSLRQLFLEENEWQWLFGFENRKRIFDIHSSFKFCALILRRGGTTSSIRTAFMRRELGDWNRVKPEVTPYSTQQVHQLSPRTLSFLEIRHVRDLGILEKIYHDSILFSDNSPDGWGIRYRKGNFNMASDSHLFKPRTWWEDRGYQPDIYGRWIRFDSKTTVAANS